MYEEFLFHENKKCTERAYAVPFNGHCLSLQQGSNFNSLNRLKSCSYESYTFDTLGLCKNKQNIDVTEWQ